MAIVVPIVADTSSLTRGLAKSQSSLLRFGKTAAIVGGAAALGGLVATIKVGIDEFTGAQKVMAQTNAVLKSTGGAAKVTAKEITSLSGSIMEKTGIDDEAIQSGQNLLLTFTNIRNETGKGNDIFNQATRALVDMSVAMGTEVSGSAIQLGKALNDPIKGVTALTRVGVTFTDEQKKQIKAMVDAGNVAGAQKIILAELTKEFGGSAEAAGKTLSGQLNILKQTFSNVAGELVSIFIPTLATAATKLVDFVREFGSKPTLEAKIKFVIGSIGNVVWTGIRSIYTWWDQQGRVELPARVILVPSGRQQFDAFFKTLEADARAAGNRMGVAAIRALAGVFTSEGRSKLAGAAQSFSDAFGGAAQFWFRVTGTTVIQEFIAGLLSAIPTIAGRIGPALRDALLNALSDATKALPAPIRNAVKDAFAAVRKGEVSKSNIITATVAAAVQDARKQLQSFGSSLVAFMSQKRSALLRISGGPNAAEITAEQRRIEDERFKIAEKAARDALATSEDTTSAQLDLDQLLLDRQQTLRDRALQDAEDADKKTIDNLIEQFNRGLISAQDFSNQLRSYIGADFGSELGLAFSGAFSRELQSVLALVADIQKVAGQSQPIAPEAPGVSGALRAENQRRFDEALADWQKRRAARLKMAEDYRKRPGSAGGSTITAAEAAEIKAIMADWDKANAKPARAAYGLARGGILTQPTFVAGEAGKEAVIPLNSTSAMNILRDAIGSSGGGSTTVYNLTVNAGLGTDPDELGRTIVESIKRFEKRNGQAFSAPLLSVTQNIAGQTSTGSTKSDFNRVTTLRKG